MERTLWVPDIAGRSYMKKQKIEEYRKLLTDSETVLRTHPDLWKEFLDFATQFTHYGFYEQLLIYAQNQEATACATYEQWKKIGRYVRSGENGIVLLDESGNKTRLRYVFDVTATGPNKEFLYKPEAILEEERENLAKRLSNAYANQNSVYASYAASWEGDLTGTLSQMALYMTEDDLQITAKQAADLTENGELPPAFVAAATSAMYLLLDKYGLSTSALDFSCMEKLEPEEFQLAGITASNVLSRVARMVRSIMPAIRQERGNEYGRERNDNGGYSKENHLPEGGRLYDPEHWIVTGGRGSTGIETLRDDEERLSEGESSDRLRDDGIERDSVQTLQGGRSRSRSDKGNDASEVGEGSGSNGRTEGERTNGMGTQDGDVQPTGERSDHEGTDIPVTGSQLTLFDYMELDPIERDEVSIDISETDESNQESLTDTEKIVESVEAVGEIPAAFSIYESDIDQVLQYGSGFEDGKIRIAAIYQKEPNAAKRASFLKEEYGIGGRTFAFENGTRGWLDYNTKGIYIGYSYSVDAPKLHLTWKQVESKLGKLIKEGRYLFDMEEKGLIQLEYEYGVLPVPTPGHQYPSKIWISEPVEDVQQIETRTSQWDTHAPTEVLSVRKTTDGYIIWNRLQGGIHTEPDGTVGGPYIDEAQAQIKKQEFQRKMAERSANNWQLDETSIQALKNGDTIILDGTSFRVEHIGQQHVQLRDPKLQYPVFRSESKENLIRLLQMEGNRVVSSQETKQQNNKEQNQLISEAEPSLEVEQPQIDKQEEAIVEQIPAQNYHIASEDLGEGRPREKYQSNAKAIRLLKELETENRNARPEEQAILSKYVGWGGLADVFDEKKTEWNAEYQELKALLSKDEYEAARASTLNAHYTSPTIIKGIYNALEKIGFKKGSILEPALGVGNFFGMLPDSMKESRLYGVELDSISGRIAQKLYPIAQITVAGFETTDRRDFYDVAIGNVPFGNYRVNDRAYNRLNFSIHNYFFAKSLDQVRPGGIVAFITSHYTMDAKNSSARRYIAQRAELLGAIRLPNDAFLANAGVEVVSDIIFLQKRDHIMDIDADWVHLGMTNDGYAINNYFVAHPEMVLGIEGEQSSRFGMEYTVQPDQENTLSELLSEAIKRIQGTYHPAMEVNEQKQLVEDVIPADPDVRNYTYTLVNGEVYYRENSIMRRAESSQSAKERIKGLLLVRSELNDLIQLQMDDASDEEIHKAQSRLEQAYDTFSKKHGSINSRQNAQAMEGDSSYYLLCSLENLDENGKLKSKADIFTKRTIRAARPITSVETAADALAISIGEKGRVDLAYMEELLQGQKSKEEITKELTGVIFRDPSETDDRLAWKTSDEYLCGNVRQKLKLAEISAELDEQYVSNVEALKKAQPKDLTAAEIDVRLGATWVDVTYIEQFMYEVFQTPYYMRKPIRVRFFKQTGEWRIEGKSYPSGNDVNAYIKYGTSRMNAYAILEQTLNLRSATVYDRITDENGNAKSVVNQKETMLAQQRQQMIKEEFANWIWKDPYRRKDLEQVYNERFNSLRPAEFSGDHINFVGMNPQIGLRQHQKNAVAHILYGGNTLLAHEVGAGKTYTMAAAAMESKRLGLCQKSLFVVPNHLTLQWANEFLRLYPAANLLVASKKDFEKANRKKFCAKIATGDYDAIIIGHSQFEKIPVSAERQERLIKSQIKEIEAAIQEAAQERGENFTIKQLEKTRKNLESRLERLKAEERKDDVVIFEQLGVDRLFVDEAHAYKNLFLYTKMRNVSGLSMSEAQKSSDMFQKCQYMDEITGGKGIIFATGTPVSNSMTELYTMMRYLQYGALRERGLTQFDAWASTFGETVTASELAPEGTGYRQKTRFAKFFNLPELMNLFKQTADIKTADQLKLPVPEAKFQTVVVQPSELQKEMVANLSERAASIHAGTIDPTIDNMLKVTSDGRKIGLDQRLMNPMLPDDSNSKLNMCIKNVLQIWKDGSKDHLTQLIFCDTSTPKKDGTFNVYDDIKVKLIAGGIPKEEVAYIHDADTEVKKKELFAKVRSGQVRVLLGSTQKMGAGTNVQERLIAVHHLDVGWRPADLTQRNGRIIRQGNTNPVVQIYNYVTEGTFDAYLWQMLENKQRFIGQIMTSKSPVRSCEDVDEQVLSYAEVKALCAGDSRIKEKMDLEVEVAKLRMLKSEYQSTQYRLEDRLLKKYPEQIKKKEARIAGIEVDQKTAEQHPKSEDNFVGIEVLGIEYTDKKEAGKALLQAGLVCKGSSSEKIGAYRGFELSRCYNIASSEIQLEIQGQLCYPFSFSKTDWVNLSKLDAVLDKLPEVLKEEKQKLDALRQQMYEAQKQLGQSFPQEEVLKEKTKRLKELAAELDMDSSTKTNSAEEIIKTGYHKQTENTPLKQLRFSHLRQKRAEIKAGMEY